MQPERSFRNKIKRFFSSICSGPTEVEPSNKVEGKQKKQKNSKTSILRKETRQTITIEDVFVKRSRKNIVEEEFFTNDILNLQMERHLFMRIKGALTGLVYGEFGQEVVQGIKFPIFIDPKPIKTIPIKEVIQTGEFFSVRQNSVDLLLYQTMRTRSPLPKKLVAQQENKEGQDEVDEIENVLLTYSSSIPNIVILCSPSMEPQLLKEVLHPYSHNFLFELENVRKNQEMVCNVLYISGNPTFLRINNKCFTEEVISKMSLTLQDGQKMKQILDRLADSSCHCRILEVVRGLKEDNILQGLSCFSEFILRASEDSEMREVIRECKQVIFHENTIEETPVLFEPTPVFGKK